MKHFVADSKVILNLAGLRFVVKVDSTYSLNPEKYSLEWEYKGSKGSMAYEKQEDRDRIYTEIREVLCHAEVKA